MLENVCYLKRDAKSTGGAKMRINRKHDVDLLDFLMNPPPNGLERAAFTTTEHAPRRGCVGAWFPELPRKSFRRVRSFDALAFIGKPLLLERHRAHSDWRRVKPLAVSQHLFNRCGVQGRHTDSPFIIDHQRL